MVAGDLAAFPAGTGISHCFINNSGREVLLLVGGEKPVRKVAPDARAVGRKADDGQGGRADHERLRAETAMPVHVSENALINVVLGSAMALFALLPPPGAPDGNTPA